MQHDGVRRGQGAESGESPRRLSLNTVTIPESTRRLSLHEATRRLSAKPSQLPTGDDVYIHSAPADDTAVALSRKGCFCGGVADDVRRRARHYGSDWHDPFRSLDDGLKTISSAVNLFMALFFVQVALAEAFNDGTNGAVGVTEVLLLIAVSGVVQTLVGVQPLIVLRPTGPIVLLTIVLYDLSDTLWADEGEGPDQQRFNRVQRFFQLSCATGIFVAIEMGVIAGLELNRNIAHMTQFTLEIFEVYVCSVMIYVGLDSIAKLFERAADDSDASLQFGDALFSLFLTLIVFSVSMLLANLSRLRVANPRIRGG